MNDSARIIHILPNGTLSTEEKDWRNLRPLFHRGERVQMEVIDPVWQLIPVRVLHIGAIQTFSGLWVTNYTVIDRRERRHKVSECALLQVNPRKPHPDYLDLMHLDAELWISEPESMTGADFEEETGPVMEEKRPWWKRMVHRNTPDEAQDDDTLSEREGEDKRTREERDRL